MAARIDVQYTIPDARAQVKQHYFNSIGLSHPLTAVSVVDSYTVDARLGAAQLRQIAHALANPVMERAMVNGLPGPQQFGWALEIGFLPGVTDNIATTARETIEDLLKRKFKPDEGVYSSQVFFISGRLSADDVKKVADSLHNPLIQRAQVWTAAQLKSAKRLPVIVPKVQIKEKVTTIRVDLNVADTELAKLGKEGIVDPRGFRRGPLALDLESMKAIRSHFARLGRKPSDIELESLAQTWSEHCKHTIFADPIDDIERGLYKTYIQGATNAIRKAKGKKDFCVSVFTDNSGAIEFDKDFLVTHKVETHNTPSALDPFGGAITGIVGVNRDTLGFGLGAKPIANVYGFCLADPKDKSVLYRDTDMKQKMLSSRRIMEGVVAGVNAGGNQSGIPTPQGFIYFDERYRGKPLVFAGTVGMMPRKSAGRLSHLKRARAGDLIVMLGGRVGRDGIHGATFSSEALDSGSPSTAVQIGDPITQKKMSDALIKEARDQKLYNSITDNGAGGLSCSVAEMAKESGGCMVNLEKVPLKYPGLSPWQIWISESQERMTLAVPKNKWKSFQALMARRGVEATVIGQFTNSKRCMVKFHNKVVMDLEMSFLHGGRPRKRMETRPAVVAAPALRQPSSANLDKDIVKLLSRLNIASFEFISRQYDHEVQASSVIKPLQGAGRVNGDASVIRPRLDSNRGVVLSQALYPSYSELSPYDMAACAIDSAIRQSVSTGASLDHLALLDNFCWCDSNDPQRLAQLKDAVRACYDYATAYGTPFISGKDSMFNDFKGFDAKGRPIKISIPPTLLISAIGVIKDVTKTISIDLKNPGDLIYVLGETHDELGGSEYGAMAGVGGAVPRVNAQKNIQTYRALERVIDQGLAASAISVGSGGLAVALVKTALAGRLGLDVSLKNLPGTATSIQSKLFSESQGRIVVSVPPGRREIFEKIMTGISYTKIGTVTDEAVVIDDLKLGLPALHRSYVSTLKDY
jgi:phosphoribosylformylglycinamidine synthase II